MRNPGFPASFAAAAAAAEGQERCDYTISKCSAGDKYVLFKKIISTMYLLRLEV